ncbi:hypothetical protein [Nonomuraea helvata]|uniref:Antibiotic biosynthesis monooxygenase n=1 Tax=Nonomuraea helvata TaxID=37484 RepID=A0ABV5SBS2_9ACTN
MSTMAMIRYETRPEVADDNQRIVEQVFAELNAEDPGGLRYMSLRLADGVTFVHVVISDGDLSPLTKLSAFTEFQRGLGERVVGAPVRVEATLVGSYGMGG